MYSARVILDSVGPNDARLTTFELQYPRFVHAELMTHRMLSRNSASSRAIPVEKLLQQVENDPAMPVWWGKNQSGMQAREELGSPQFAYANNTIVNMRCEALREVRYLQRLGLHKQIANRYLEPWMFITVIVTATELENVRGLRVDPDAQPEIERVMRMAFEAYDKSIPQRLESGQWHLPLVTGYDEEELRLRYTASRLALISAGRCARVSYLTHEGKRDPDADLALAEERLLPSGHLSPFEHQARALTHDEWLEYALRTTRNWVSYKVPTGNFWGWAQFRKELYMEYNFMKIKSVC